MIFIKNSIIAIDDSVIDELNSADSTTHLQHIVDYLLHANKKIITTEDCWKKIKDSNIKEMTKKILKGLISICGCKTADTKDSIVKLMNFKSQFDPTILLTRHDYSVSGLSVDVNRHTFSSFASKCLEDEEYITWRATELWKIQKFKG